MFATGARYKATVPVCIAGMPRSGMALVSRLLGGIGLDVGPVGEVPHSPDGEGRFSQLNDEILSAVGAAWDSPPRGNEWVHASELQPLRRGATDLTGALGLSEPWGWADPRNSLTLPFWRELFPDLRLLVCVRDPREVAASLQADGVISSQQALSLWEEYYGTLLDVTGETPVITHYDSYLDDPRAELERLGRGLGLDSSQAAVAWTAAGVEAPTAGGDVLDDELPRGLHDLYERLLEAAKSPVPEAQPMQGAPPGGHSDLPAPLEAQRRELEHLRLELARTRGYIEALRAEVEVRSQEPADLREVALNLEQQLVERDEELERLRTVIREGDAWKREMEAVQHETDQTLARAVEEVEVLRTELGLIKSTRLWSAGQQYWALKERLRQALRRGSS